jgi:hypothetical protein
MVEQTEAAAERDNTLLKNLAKLGIPENFPIELTSLEPSTLEFCKLENLSTIGEFAVFAQSMSQNVIVGGDFRKLLNALSHIDEAALAEALPFRRGHKGLHLVEAVALAARTPDGPARTELATTWFSDELAAIEKDLAAGGTIERYFVALADPTTEPTPENTRLVQFLALMLERKKILRPKGRSNDGARNRYEHAKSKAMFEVPAGDLTPEFFVAVQEQLSVLVRAPKPKPDANPVPQEAGS